MEATDVERGELAKRKDKRDQARKLEAARETAIKTQLRRLQNEQCEVSKEQNQEVIAW